jgi:hypothetical protein
MGFRLFFEGIRMKKALKIIVVALAVLFVVAQFIRPDYSDPPIVPGQEMASSMEVPGEVAAIFERSCVDCHSNKTTYPWYSQIAPVSWWLKNHINEGRHELNTSEWGTYTDRKKSKKLEEICEQVEAREMPLPSYTWIHRDSFLSEDDLRTICDWTNAERAKIPTAQ